MKPDSDDSPACRRLICLGILRKTNSTWMIVQVVGVDTSGHGHSYGHGYGQRERRISYGTGTTYILTS
ncbi:hypothetical protein PSHT_00692 [Puccinia striiformis]|uniref:Uncharacterized protein n=2 Tax=Puccinia striiformis TaxID=27350 RepID=A0A2S4WMG1_9BASI|nr:hypothetical protein PSTT_01721 [Puccinia striiformis]POW22942.1 hypothetical protein PSHT_00692 [Puccinia striiformis]